MSKPEQFQERINYQGELRLLLMQVCNDYSVGEYKNHSVIAHGYEDFNLLLETDNGKLFVKIFASFRTPAERQRYVEIMTAVLAAGVQTPLLYRGKKAT